jgi:hypothetical protein
LDCDVERVKSSRRHDVKNNHVIFPGLQQFLGRMKGSGRIDAAHMEQINHGLKHIGLVVHDQDLFSREHSISPICLRLLPESRLTRIFILYYKGMWRSRSGPEPAERKTNPGRRFGKGIRGILAKDSEG